MYNMLQVLYKEGTGHGEEGVGGNWTPIMGKMRQVSIGDKVGLTSFNPNWTPIMGKMRQVSIGDKVRQG